MAGKKYDVKSLALADEGRRRIAWADERMPVLRRVREEFARDKPLRGLKVSACLHVTTETANLMRTLRDGGADVALCGSNPLSTQDDAAASLVRDQKIPVYAVCGEDRNRYYAHLRAALDRHPQVTLDDGADLVTLLHTEYAVQAPEVMASMEETTTGVIRLRAMERDAALKIPVIGPILNKAAIARYARTLSTMFAAGVPLVEALDSVAGATGNIVYENAVIKMRDEVSTGQRLQRAMENTGLFPNMVNQMIAVGEESGSLDEMSGKVATFYEAEVDNAVDAMSSLLEPMIMVILGVLVGSLVIAMYLPIFKLGSVV